jgi:hypothetical protein
MIAFLSLLLHVVVSPFRTKARLEAEIILLRHQLGVLRQRVPSKPRLTVADRLVFVWLYRLFPSVLEHRHDCPTGNCYSMASDGLPTVLALEVALSRRSAKDPRRDPAPDPGDEPRQPAVGRAPHPW